MASSGCCIRLQSDAGLQNAISSSEVRGISNFEIDFPVGALPEPVSLDVRVHVQIANRSVLIAECVRVHPDAHRTSGGGLNCTAGLAARRPLRRTGRGQRRASSCLFVGWLEIEQQHFLHEGIQADGEESSVYKARSTPGCVNARVAVQVKCGDVAGGIPGIDVNGDKARRDGVDCRCNISGPRIGKLSLIRSRENDETPIFRTAERQNSDPIAPSSVIFSSILVPLKFFAFPWSDRNRSEEGWLRILLLYCSASRIIHLKACDLYSLLPLARFRRACSVAVVGINCK